MPSKKSFKTNPAEAFITLPDPEDPIQEETKTSQHTGGANPPKGYKANPEYIEVKSKRVQLLLQPSTVTALKALAKRKGVSMNEAANEAIKQFLERES